MRSLDVLDLLPGDVCAELGKHSRIEAVRTLRARAQLEHIGDVSAKRNWSLVVLKGGRALLDDPEAVYQLADLDLLVPPEQLSEVAAWFDSQGLSTSNSRARKHLGPRYADGALPVEVHWTINDDGSAVSDSLWESTIPLSNGLLGLSPLEHAWHVLYHEAVSHLGRRGQLRGLDLLARALNSCPLDDLDRLHHRAVSDRFAQPLGSFLCMATQALGGEPVTDRFELMAFTRYFIHVAISRSRWNNRMNAKKAAQAVFAVQAGREEFSLFLYTRPSERSPRRIMQSLIGPLDRVSTRLGGGTGVLIRRMFRIAVASIALPTALWIRFVWKRAKRTKPNAKSRTARLYT